jgi:uncharacterized protein YjbI with pentapeptide repeats
MTKPYSQVWLYANKFLRQTPKPIWIALGVAGIFIGLWWFQQSNVNALGRKIISLEQKIGQMSVVDERLKLEKDILVIEKDKTTIQNGVYTTLVQAAGGLILSITAYVGYCNFKIGEENLKIGQKNLKVAEDKQVTERFSKAIEHLGSEKIDIRLGGIYALEQIAIDSPKYHWTVVEILSAFVREKCTIQKVVEQRQQLEKVSADIQAALTVLGRRKINQDPPQKSIDLRNTYLAQVELPEAKLSGVNLIGVNLSGANLSDANLIGVNLSGANLSGANLIGANLSDANLSDANLSGADFSKAKLINANLYRANLINLSDTNLSNVNFSEANLSKANLGVAIFSNANLKSANLSNADLRFTKLINAILIDADLNEANLTSAKLHGADLRTCKNLTRSQFMSAMGDESTKLLPEDLIP